MAKVIKDSKNKSSVRITNRSRQMIPLQLKPPNGDFFYEEHQARLLPGKSVILPKDFLNISQIENCKARGDISISDL